MKKLDESELAALGVLAKYHTIVPGDSLPQLEDAGFMAALRGLVRKKRATGFDTDDGPGYRVNAQGLADAP